jgi:dipeptide transport system permease protein
VTPLLKKLATLIPTLIGERRLDPVAHAALMAKLGLDQPLVVQYFRYVGELLQGNLGTSIVTREPVLGEFLVLFPATIELAFAALLLAVVGGLALGVAAALKRGSWLDQAVMALATVGNSMPVFWWGLILIMFFSVGLEWTPVSGRVAIEYDIPFVTGFMLVDTLLSDEPGSWRSAVLHLALPATVLGTIPMAVVARMTRSSMLEVLREDYMRTARAKGLPPGRIVVVHGLRNALIPVLTVLGLQVGGLLGGAVLTETIFSWPGIGKWLIEAIARRDYPVVQAGILVSALTFIVVNLVVDLLYGVVNPRLRGGGH